MDQLLKNITFSVKWAVFPKKWSKGFQPFSANIVWPQNQTKCQMSTHTQDKVEKTKSLSRSWIKPGELQMQRESKLESRRKTYLQTHGSVWKAMGSMGSIVLIVPVSSQALEPLSIFCGHFMGKQNVDLKQIDYKLFLQQKDKTWFIWDQQRISVWVWPCTSLHKAREGECFYRGEKEVGKTTVNCEDFSLAESLQGKKRSLDASCWALLVFQKMRTPPAGLSTPFNWGFCLIFHFPFKIKLVSTSPKEESSTLYHHFLKFSLIIFLLLLSL